VVSPHKPDERSVRRRHDGVSPNAAIPAVEFHDGEISVCWSGSREAECQPLCVAPFCRRTEPTLRGPKEFSDATRELVTAQIVGWFNVIRRKNQTLQIWSSKKRRRKAALIWPYRRVSIFPLHSYPLSPASRGAFFLLLLPPVAGRWARPCDWRFSVSRSYRGRAPEARRRPRSTKKYFRIRCPSLPGNGPPHFRQDIC
jgi:hypothetical protein